MYVCMYVCVWVCVCVCMYMLMIVTDAVNTYGDIKAVAGDRSQL